VSHGEGWCTLAVVSVEQLAAIGQVHNLLEAHHLDYWLFGGWAVDFHAGRVTRSHADIDLAVWLSDLDCVRQRLEETGWRVLNDQMADGYVAFERSGVVIEVALLERDELGVIYTPAASGRGDWPAGSFGSDASMLNGVTARVVGLESLIIDKADPKGGPDAAAKDRVDVAVLTDLDAAARSSAGSPPERGSGNS
jgi:hypothetical protein